MVTRIIIAAINRNVLKGDLCQPNEVSFYSVQPKKKLKSL